jgi:hypothetical protein
VRVLTAKPVDLLNQTALKIGHEFWIAAIPQSSRWARFP